VVLFYVIFVAKLKEDVMMSVYFFIFACVVFSCDCEKFINNDNNKNINKKSTQRA